jgi:hypothetical protein
MPLVEFETTIHAGKRPHTHPLDRAATRIGTKNSLFEKLFYDQVKLESGEDRLNQFFIIHTYLSHNLTQIFYLLLFTSVAETVYR